MLHSISEGGCGDTPLGGRGEYGRFTDDDTATPAMEGVWGFLPILQSAVFTSYEMKKDEGAHSGSPLIDIEAELMLTPAHYLKCPGTKAAAPCTKNTKHRLPRSPFEKNFEKGSPPVTGAMSAPTHGFCPIRSILPPVVTPRGMSISF